MLLLVLLAGIVAILVRGLTLDRPLTGTLGVLNREPTGYVDPGYTACQGPVQVDAGTTGVTWVFNTRLQPGPRLLMEARAAGSGRVLRRVTVAPGYGDGPKTILVPELPSDHLLDLCVVNEGRTPVDVYGTKAFPFSNDTSELRVTRQGRPGDAYMLFDGDPGEHALGRVPAAFRHAGTWLPAPLGTWSFWVLALLVLVAVPAICVMALRAATDEPPRA